MILSPLICVGTLFKNQLPASAVRACSEALCCMKWSTVWLQPGAGQGSRGATGAECCGSTVGIREPSPRVDQDNMSGTSRRTLEQSVFKTDYKSVVARRRGLKGRVMGDETDVGGWGLVAALKAVPSGFDFVSI